jgi:hypothetical protein
VAKYGAWCGLRPSCTQVARNMPCKSVVGWEGYQTSLNIREVSRGGLSSRWCLSPIKQTKFHPIQKYGGAMFRTVEHGITVCREGVTWHVRRSTKVRLLEYRQVPEFKSAKEQNRTLSNVCNRHKNRTCRSPRHNACAWLSAVSQIAASAKRRKAVWRKNPLKKPYM